MLYHVYSSMIYFYKFGDAVAYCGGYQIIFY